MVHLIKGILTKDECINLTKQYEIDKKINPSIARKKDTGNTYDFEPSYIFNVYLDTLKAKILEINPEIQSLNNVNSFIREYRNNDFLTKHKDRLDISVTMSICLDSTINKEWPICFDIDNKEYCYNTEIGDAILLFDADKITHWRDTLVCGLNERVLQFFLHWKPVNYDTKKINSLI